MTQIWGHRGAMAYCPENTIASFEKAVKLGVSGIELDVHLTKDNCLVVCHDEEVNRTTNGKGWIKDMTYNEIRKLDAGSWFDKKFTGLKIPSLIEVFNLYKCKDIIINVEIKAGSKFYPGIEEKVIKLINKCKLKEKVIVSSFDHRAIVKIKEIDKSIKTGLLYVAALHKPVDYLKKVGADALHPHYLTIDSEVVKSSKKNNIPINTYTVNNMSTVEMLAKYNINAIITNYPDKALEVVNSNC